MANQDEQEIARQRAVAFATDLVIVCKKHNVMIHPSDLDCEASDVCFSEHNTKGQFTFSVDLVTIEASVREIVWPHVYGKKD